MLNYRYERHYQGPIQAVIFDWAGTTLDYGCVAPTLVFVEIFEQAGVPITMEEARRPMGTNKKEHLREILEMNRVKADWEAKYNRAPTEQDVDMLFENFVPIQLDCISKYSNLIPGTKETITRLRQKGYKIGSTTGYLRNMTEVIAIDAEKQGYKPDTIVCADDVPQGRPHPFMCLQNMINLEITDRVACVKVDDTVPGIHEGLSAGMWTIGLAMCGNEVGLSLDEFNALPENEKAEKRTRAYTSLSHSGAHYVVDSITDILPCLEDIERKLAKGETP